MKILVATDGSAFSEWAQKDMLRAGLPQPFDAIVLSSANLLIPPGSDWATSDRLTDNRKCKPENETGIKAIAEFEMARAKEIADEGVKYLSELFPDSHIVGEVVADPPAVAILDRAKEWNADLIVVGARGLSALGRLILGSVSQKVVTHSDCPVRIARPGEKTTKDKIKLVLGMDGSEEAKRATDVIASRKWPAETEIAIISVLNPRLSTSRFSYMPEIAASIQESYRDEEEWLRSIVQEESEKLKNAGLKVTGHIVFGDPKKVLIESAEDGSIDCIFVGARGLSGMKRFLMGSVSGAVSSRAYCSVEVIRHK
jgi:nucleotide-binding universal stress UspA family protein